MSRASVCSYARTCSTDTAAAVDDDDEDDAVAVVVAGAVVDVDSASSSSSAATMSTIASRIEYGSDAADVDERNVELIDPTGKFS